jgi:predicted membrane-bound spermidine synthase
VGALAFVGGFASIGLELTASRLIAPYFGSSTFIWANLIGVTLAFLSLGYYLGGKLADRRPDASLLYLLVGLAGVATALIPVVSRSVLRNSLAAFDERDAGAFLGSLTATLLLFAPAITLLGMVAPFAIRLRLVSLDEAGRAAGNLYALSTLGSILGSFVPVLLLIPAMGTRLTLLLLAALLVVMSIAGLIIESAGRRAVPLAAAAAVALLLSTVGLAGNIKPPYRGELLAEVESDNNYLQVVQDGDDRLLIMNEGQAIHSIYNPDRLETGGPWDYFLLGPYLAGTRPPESALIVGLAGGTTARQLHAAFPGIDVDGVEVDPAVAEVARDYFGLTEEIADVTVGDGRYVLRTSNARYDLVCLDAYRQPYVPFHLATREFFGEVRAHLQPGGVVAINAGRTDRDFRLVDALSATMRAVFATVVVVDVQEYDNSLIFATDAPTSLDAFRARLEQLEPRPIVTTTAATAHTSGNIRLATAIEPVLTDDHAPVEWIIDQIIVDEALREDP